MLSEERLLPAEAIRRDHVTENEITRHRITSFQLVEHTQQCGGKSRLMQEGRVCTAKMRSLRCARATGDSRARLPGNGRSRFGLRALPPIAGPLRPRTN